METTVKPANYTDDEKMALVASVTGVLFSKIKLVLKNALKNAKLAKNDQLVAIVEILAEQVIPQFLVTNMAKNEKLSMMHSLVYLLASKAQSVFTSGVVRTCIDQNWDLKGFKAVLLRILKEVGLSSEGDTTKLKEYFEKLIQSQNLQSQSCIKAISQFLKNPKRQIEEDDLKNPVDSFQSYYEFVRADVERYRAQNMKYECFQVLHPWAYDLDQVDFKYVINKDQTQQICRQLKGQEARVFWLSFFKAQLSASADEFIGALREYCIMNQVKEHFDARYESQYKLFMLKNNFSISLLHHSQEIEQFIMEAHNEANRRYSGMSLLHGDQVRLPQGASNKLEDAKVEYINIEKLGKLFKIPENLSKAYFDLMNIGNVHSWNWTSEQASIRLDMSRGTFTLAPNHKQEEKLVLRFASVDTDELRDLEVKFTGDQAQFKVGEGDCNHYVIANDKKLWESQFMIISKDGRYFIRDLGVVHTSRLKVTPATALQLHQGALIDLGKVVHYHVNKLTHETAPKVGSAEQFVVMRGTQADYKIDDEAILRARPAWVSSDENRDMVQNEILLEANSKQNKFSIGRSNRRDVELKLKAVSADHCKIEYSKDKGWYIHEQGKDRLSSNGTFVFMKSHQQMEDHEPSDLIPLFNGMIISFINYELQVRIEPKNTEEMSHAKFENYGPLASAPASVKHESGQVKQERSTPMKEETKFDQTAQALTQPSVVVDDHHKVAQTEKVSLSELKQHDQHSPQHSVGEEEKVEHQAQVPEPAKELIDVIWEKYDRDNSGQLSNAEMRPFVQEYLHKLGEGDRLPEKQFNAMFASLDVNHDGQISKDEMKAFIGKVRATEIEQIQQAVAEVIHNEQVKELIDEIWESYDKDHSGQLSNAEMKPFVQEYLTKLGEGDRLPEKQFNSMFASLDQNHDGQISKDEMKTFIEKVRATQIEQIQEAAAEAIHQEEVKELIDEIWEKFDKDHSGQLSKAEMKVFVLEYLTRLGENNRLPEKQFNSMFASLDENHDGQISKAEMKDFIEKVRGAEVVNIQEAVAEVIHQEEVKDLIDQIWATYDIDHSGQLSKAEMKQFVKEYLNKIGEGERLPESQFNTIFASLDENNDGQISKPEMREFIDKVRATQVEEVKEAVAELIHQEEVKELIDEIWAVYDKDHSGQLSKAEIKPFVTEYLHKLGEAGRLPEEQFNAMFAQLDENHDGQISKAEIKDFIEKIRATEVKAILETVAQAVQEQVKELIDEIWAAYDKDNSGQLNKAEMKSFVKEYLTKLGEADRLPENQFNSMFASLDENNDGQISKAEMKEFIEKIRATEIKEVVAEIIKQEETKELIDQIWAKYDKDNSGQLSKAEMKPFVQEYLDAHENAKKLPEKQFNAMFAQIDENHDGQISKAEIKEFIQRVLATDIEHVAEAVAEIIHQEEVKELIDEIWSKYDKDNSGQLSNSEMKGFVKEYLNTLGEGDRLPEKQFNALFASLDGNHDGQISKAEMKQFIEKIRATEIEQVQEAIAEATGVELQAPKEKTLIEQIWEKYDTDKNGTLNKSEAKVFVKDYLLNLGEADRLPEEQFNAIFAELDGDANGKISPEEMTHYIEKVRATEASKHEEAVATTPKEIIDEVWEQFDKDNSGALSRAETRNFVKVYLMKVGEGERFPEDQFAELFKEFDEDGNGIITKKEMQDFIEKVRQ